MRYSSASLVIAFIVLIITALVSLTIGRYSISVEAMVEYITTGRAVDENLPLLLLNVRLPRILGAVLAGGALSVSGAAYQGLFRNPMVSPDILGVSSGAGFGAALAILFSSGLAAIQASAFVVGLGAVFMAVTVSRFMPIGHDRILMLVLSGMITSSLFGALVSLMKYVADSESRLPDIVFWLMGSLSGITMREVIFIAPVIVVMFVVLQLVSWKLNVLSFGEEEAMSMGVNTKALRMTVIVCASLLTASVVAVTGLIGWIGLIIPHLARFVVGPNHRFLLPASFLIGGTFLLLVDDLSRTATSLEIPLGIITSMLGAPMFFGILKISTKRVW